jgi:hypothetical protein
MIPVPLFEPEVSNRTCRDVMRTSGSRHYVDSMANGASFAGVNPRIEVATPILPECRPGVNCP